jgi:hypothetical protein
MVIEIAQQLVVDRDGNRSATCLVASLRVQQSTNALHVVVGIQQLVQDSHEEVVLALSNFQEVVGFVPGLCGTFVATPDHDPDCCADDADRQYLEAGLDDFELDAAGTGPADPEDGEQCGSRDADIDDQSDHEVL